MIKVKLSEICDLQNGYAFKSSDYVENSNTLSCRMSNIRLGGIFDIEYNPRFLPDSFADQYKGFLLKDGDLVIAMTDLANDPKLLGVPTLVQTDGRNILLNQRVGKLIIKDSSKVDNKYLQHVLNDPKTREYYRKFASGGLQINLGKSDLLNVEIPLPPLAEQRRIASILDQADDLRQKRQQAIEKLDQLLQATFIDMFGDPVSNPKQFICKTLEQISSFENGDRSSNYPSGNDLVFAGIPFLSTKNIRCNVYDETNLNFITEEKFSSLSRGKVKNNEILITLRGTLGATCIFKSKYDTAFINAQMMIIRSDPLIMSNDFLHAILSFESMQEYFRRVGQGAAVPQLTATQLKKLEIIIPSIELQNEFLRINQEIQKLKNEFSNSFSKYDLLFKSLQNQAFNGTL